MDTQPISNCCPKCQSPLPPDAPQGLCPKCLFAAVAMPTEAGQPAGHRATPPPLAEIAAAFPQLQILEFIGQGGMGFVFKARQPKLDRLVALKILPQSLAADPTFAERFNREARLLARLSHPGIVTVHDFGVATTQTPDASTQTQFYYLLMEFVDGVNLRQAMQAGRFTPEQALAIVPRICEALQFAHNEGVLHRDIKPENILLDAKGRVKLADFGIAKLMERGCVADQPQHDGAGKTLRLAEDGTAALPNLTETGKTLGTPNYMAPEQIERPQDVDHRADIYSLGVVFYEMLTGELPLGRFPLPSQKSAADPRVDEVVLRALEKEKAKRYASADEVRTQVETISSGSSRREEAPTESEKPHQDFMTWSPLQSPAVGEICSHLTKTERNLVSVVGLLTAVWIPGTCFGLLALIRSDVGAGKWIVASVWAILFIVSIPMLQQLIRHFLCSTAWAKAQGYTPAQLRLFSFTRGKILIACTLFAALLALVFAQHQAMIRYLGLENLPQTNSTPQRIAEAPRAPSASAETWSPTLPPGEKPDLDKIRQEANDLMGRGRYEEALSRHIWYHNHALEYEPSLSGVRLSFVLSDWIELGRRYPKAKQALIEIRDLKAREFTDGGGYSGLFQDVASINSYLQKDDETYALFKAIEKRDPVLAGQCYFYAENVLVENGQFESCLKYLGGYKKRFASILDSWERMTASEKRMEESWRRYSGTNLTIPRPPSAKNNEHFFVSQTRRLIEILVGAGHKSDAEKIRGQALAVLDVPELQSAVSDAEEGIRRKLGPAKN